MWLLAFDLQRTTEFRPLHDRVVVRRIEEDMKTTGGIIIPDTAKEKPMQGKVIAVGPGARDDCGKLVPLDVKKGDRVLFGNPLTRRSAARASWGFTFWSDDSPATSR